jgi:type VI secretion system ImpM family protein
MQGLLGVFGKVPSEGDFVRHGAAGEAFSSFDAWLVDSVEWALARGGERWLEGYRAGAVCAFVFSPRGKKSLLVGAIAPSSDAAGRPFPIVVCSSVHDGQALRRSPEAAPILLEDLWLFASELVSKAPSDGGASIVAKAAAARFACSMTETDAQRAYDEWAASMPIAELWVLILEQAAPDSARATFQLVAETLRPFRRIEHPDTPLTLRLPLGAAGGAALCFWLDLVRRLSGWRATMPSLFWFHDGERGAVLLHIGNPPRSTVAELWMPSGARDEICDLVGPLSPGLLQALPPLSPVLARFFEGSEAPVSQFLQAVSNA